MPKFGSQCEVGAKAASEAIAAVTNFSFAPQRFSSREKPLSRFVMFATSIIECLSLEVWHGSVGWTLLFAGGKPGGVCTGGDGFRSINASRGPSSSAEKWLGGWRRLGRTGGCVMAGSNRPVCIKQKGEHLISIRAADLG